MIQTRTHYSIKHLLSAAELRRVALELEDGRAPLSGLTPADEARSARHAAAVIGSWLTSVGSLEAMVNEIWADSVDYKQRLAPLGDDAIARIERFGPHVDRLPTLEKASALLSLLDAPAFDRGGTLWHEIRTLKKMRNRLVHFTPRWNVSGAAGDLDAPLTGRFTLNPFTSAGNAFFPDKCISADACRWAMAAVLAFSDEFHARIGLPPAYEHVRAQFLAD